MNNNKTSTMDPLTLNMDLHLVDEGLAEGAEAVLHLSGGGDGGLLLSLGVLTH